MFTGIIEEIGILKEIKEDKNNLLLTMHSSFTGELKINQSIAHNGICLTVIDLNKSNYTVCVVEETIQKTNIKSLKTGDLINLERCLSVGDRVDGHFVQGHIDCAIKCCEIGKQNGSWMFKFQCPKKYTDYLTEKGSITLNGISLTIACLNDSGSSFDVAIIPYTFKHTNFNKLKEKDYVNVEFDIISKQIARLNQKK